jgi:hypothetical protein
MKTIRSIQGKLLGHRLHSHEKDFIHSDIVHIPLEGRPLGPAENAIVEVKHFKGRKEASYIPWVGYFDLDREKKSAPSHWRIVEPALDYDGSNITWMPFKTQEQS